ncbi:hypothetical protein [Corynebacterium sp. A21]|uniref:hypothetical protein n=1 Tax=Corynebacterium sp. A21 TaxID=3457318 RepID=UPI003FD1E90A
MTEDPNLTEVRRITITQAIDPDGELLIGWEISEGATFLEVVGLLEAIKLSMNERFRNGEWEDK